MNYKKKFQLFNTDNAALVKGITIKHKNCIILLILTLLCLIKRRWTLWATIRIKGFLKIKILMQLLRLLYTVQCYFIIWFYNFHMLKFCLGAGKECEYAGERLHPVPARHPAACGRDPGVHHTRRTYQPFQVMARVRQYSSFHLHVNGL